MQKSPIDARESGYNIFHPETTSFQATVLGISVAVFAFITCSVGYTATRYLRRQRSKDLEAGENEVNLFSLKAR